MTHSERPVLLEIEDLKVHFSIRDNKQWFWQPAAGEKPESGGWCDCPSV